MPAKWTPHVVRQGEHLTALAARGSVPAAEIWSHAENAYLAKARPSGDLLAPGDVIHVPTSEAFGIPLAAGTKNRYAATVPSIRLELYLLRGDDPIDEPAGVRKRLDNLGFLRRDDADAVGQAVRRSSGCAA